MKFTRRQLPIQTVLQMLSVKKLEAEAEIYAVAHLTWMEVTGKSYEDPYPARNESAELKGEEWDFDDNAEMQKRYPRLFKIFGE